MKKAISVKKLKKKAIPIKKFNKNDSSLKNFIQKLKTKKTFKVFQFIFKLKIDILEKCERFQWNFYM